MNTIPQAPQLSSRLLRLALLWVVVLIASVVDTLFLSKQMEISTEVTRRAADIRAELYQVGYDLTTDQAKGLAIDIQGVVWRVDQTLNLAILDDESTYTGGFGRAVHSECHCCDVVLVCLSFATFKPAAGRDRAFEGQ